MTKVYTPAEMRAREAALGNVRNMGDVAKLVQADPTKKADAWMSMQPTHAKRDYSRQGANTGKIMESRYNGKCADCGGWINAGATIRFDGKAHHYPECPQETKADPMQGWDEKSQTWGEDPMGTWDANADDFRTAPKAAAKAATPDTSVTDGKWTLQFPDGHHRTFKVHTQKADASFAPGERIVKYLAKSDNMDERSYVGFAFIKAGKLVIWKRFRENFSGLIAEAQYLLNTAEAEKAGKAYAMESGNCYRCGHDLTDPTSLEAGLGPDCRKKVLG